MKWILSVMFCCLCLFQCSTKKDSQDGQKQTRFDPGACFIVIEKARMSKPVNIPAIDSIYSNDLASFIKTIDPVSDMAITDAITKGKKNEALHVQSQIISKTIQKVFFNEIVKLLGTLKSESNEIVYNSGAKKINDFYSVLSPTVIRRSEWIGKNQELEEICRMQLSTLKESFGHSSLETTLHTLEKTLKEVYIFSVFYELVGIAENRGKNEKKCEEKVVEGRIFFETVEKYAEDASLASAIKTSFETNYTEMDVEKTKEMVSRAFSFNIPEIAQ